MFKIKLLIPFLICVGGLSHAQETAKKKPRSVQLKFEDELVNGSAVKPDISNLETKKNFNYKRLIRVRENFVNEMEDGLDDFKGY